MIKDIWAEFQASDTKKKLIVVACILLALLVTLICIVDLFIIRRRLLAQPTLQPQVVQPTTALPTLGAG
jgi:hypothetical protein